MRKVFLSLLLFCVLFGAAVAQSGPVVDFEDCTAGESVEGFGTVHPYLNIEALDSIVDGTAVCIDNMTALPRTYGAPNGIFTANNCLEDADGLRSDALLQSQARGFADSVAQQAGIGHEFMFTFRTPVSDLSLRMFDFGDFNPALVTNHHVRLQAYDEDDLLLGSADLNFTSDGLVNPRDGSAGDLWFSGDACSAVFGEPGYKQLGISQEGIKRATLTVIEGPDPNVGFDSISFTLEGDMDIKFCSNPNGFSCKRKSGKVPVTLFGGGADGFDVYDIDIDTVKLCLSDDLTACTGTPLLWSYEDRGSPADIGTDSCGSRQIAKDGYDDLDLQFDAAEITELIGCSELAKGEASPDLVVTGEIAGAPFVTGADHFRVN